MWLYCPAHDSWEYVDALDPVLCEWCCAKAGECSHDEEWAATVEEPAAGVVIEYIDLT